MIRNAKALEGCELGARDGVIGSIKDIYFDDEQWQVRYLVVDTGTWLTGRTVLISSASLTSKEWGRRVVTVDLTKAQVEASPPVDTHRPVSRQQEAELHDYYGWPYYWTAPVPGVGHVAPMGQPVPPGGVLPAERASQERTARGAAADARHAKGDSHLRSTHAVRGYHIEAIDGSIGHVEDFLIDDETWTVRYIIVDTRNWWPGKKVLVSPAQIREIEWPTSQVWVNVTRDAIKAGPEYDETRSVTAEYTDRLEAHYRRVPGTTGARPGGSTSGPPSA